MIKLSTTFKESFGDITPGTTQYFNPDRKDVTAQNSNRSGVTYDMLKNRIKEEEKNAQAPKVLPFPLDRSTTQLANIYLEMYSLKTTFINTIKNGLLTNSERNLLRKQIKELEKMIKTIRIMSYNVEQITI